MSLEDLINYFAQPEEEIGTYMCPYIYTCIYACLYLCTSQLHECLKTCSYRLLKIGLLLPCRARGETKQAQSSSESSRSFSGRRNPEPHSGCN